MMIRAYLLKETNWQRKAEKKKTGFLKNIKRKR